MYSVFAQFVLCRFSMCVYIYVYCRTCFFSRASIFRDLNSIHEKYMIAEISMLIIFTVLGPFSCILAVFRVFAIFCRHCFSPIREKYKLAKILVGHSRTIDACEIYPKQTDKAIYIVDIYCIYIRHNWCPTFDT